VSAYFRVHGGRTRHILRRVVEAEPHQVFTGDRLQGLCGAKAIAATAHTNELDRPLCPACERIRIEGER
jgi:hypothetical protein